MNIDDFSRLLTQSIIMESSQGFQEAFGEIRSALEPPIAPDILVQAMEDARGESPETYSDVVVPYVKEALSGLGVDVDFGNGMPSDMKLAVLTDRTAKRSGIRSTYRISATVTQHEIDLEDFHADFVGQGMGEPLRAPSTLNLNCKSIEQVIERTKSFMGRHMPSSGLSNDFPHILEIYFNVGIGENKGLLAQMNVSVFTNEGQGPHLRTEHNLNVMISGLMPDGTPRRLLEAERDRLAALAKDLGHKIRKHRAFESEEIEGQLLSEDREYFNDLFGELRSALATGIDTLNEFESLLGLVEEIESEDDNAYREIVVPYMNKEFGRLRKNAEEMLAEELEDVIDNCKSDYEDLVVGQAENIDMEYRDGIGITQLRQGADVVDNDFDLYSELRRVIGFNSDYIVDALDYALNPSAKSQEQLNGVIHTILNMGLRDEMEVGGGVRVGHSIFDDREIKKHVTKYAGQVADLLIAFLKDTNEMITLPNY